MEFILVSKRKLDLGWIVSECPSSVAYVQTTNKVKAAPLILNKRTIQTKGKFKLSLPTQG